MTVIVTPSRRGANSGAGKATVRSGESGQVSFTHPATAPLLCSIARRAGTCVDQPVPLIRAASHPRLRFDTQLPWRCRSGLRCSV